jgi:hypothetical protein
MFSDWKYLSPEQVAALESESHEESIKALLREYLPFPSKDSQQINFAIDFHFYNYSFCKEEAFNERKISTFMSIMNDIFIADMMSAEPEKTMTSSFNSMKDLILRHCVERPPKRFCPISHLFSLFVSYLLCLCLCLSLSLSLVSILVFDRADVPHILQYVTDRSPTAHLLLPHLLLLSQLLQKIPSLQISLLSEGDSFFPTNTATGS